MNSNKNVLITGAACGIGRGLAEAFAAAGANLILCDINIGILEAVAEKINSECPIMTMKCDVSSETEVLEMFSKIEKEGRSIDILINNAGICILARIEDMDAADWDRVMSVNLKGAFLCTRQALKQLKKKDWGRIINITSPSGKTGGTNVEGMAAYAASKAGMISLTKTSAREAARYQTTVNGISPGVVDTEIVRSFTEEQRKKIISGIPMNKLQSCSDIADAAAFLASNKAGQITGQIIHVNGGMCMFE